MLMTDQPIYFERNLPGIVTLARSEGIVPVLATFAWSPLLPEAPFVSWQEYEVGLTERR